MEYFESTEQSYLGDLQVPYLTKPDIEPPNNASSFHAFPAENGWKLHHDHKLQVHPGRIPRQALAPFLQSWMFFGLVGTTVQVNGQPVLRTAELHNGRFLDVRKLAHAVRRWADWERSSEGRQSRQAEIAYVLSTARKVVHRNCVLDMITKGVGYSTLEDHPQFVPDQLALLLMILGETLSMVSTRIMEDATSHRTISYEDLEGGWGPSRWSFMQMRKFGWCPYYIRLLHHRFESHAAPLLSAYMTSHTNMTSTLEHQRCTEYVCRLKQSELSNGLQNSDSYCLPECRDSNRGTCEMVGPDMVTVRNILGRNIKFRPRKTWRGIPVFRFWPESSDKSQSVELEAHHLKTKDVHSGNFVAISHVLGDGWGNRGGKLPTCRLRYLKRMIRSIAFGQDLYFWLDTLVEPIYLAHHDRDGGWARNIAMSQVFEIFHNARYMIVLEDAEPYSLKESSSLNMTRAYLNRAWMDRLWTLQTWYSTVGQGDNAKSFSHQPFLDDALTLGQFGTSTETQIRSYLDIGNMPEKHSELQTSSSSGERSKHTMLVANAWRVARWMTTSTAAEEMLALAALLNIVSRQFQRDTPTTHTIAFSNDVKSRTAFFWNKVNFYFPGAIPAESIFLSGEQIRLDTLIGFGWIPRPWDNSDNAGVREIPMVWQDHTDLILDEGLLVAFPGLLLQPSCDSLRRQCLGMKGDDTFSFCISDKGRGEWYSAVSSPTGPNSVILAEVAGRHSQLAIIVASETISEAPARIALLVEIYEAKSVSQHPEVSSELPEMTYKCQIIRTIRVRREPTSANFDGLEIRHLPKTAPWLLAGVSSSEAPSMTQFPSRSSASQKQGAQICFGEWTSKKQKWIVDGYQAKRSIGMPKVTGIPSSNRDPSRVRIDNKASMQDIESSADEAGGTSNQHQYLASQIKRSGVWRHLTRKNSSYPPLNETRMPDAAARLVQVSLLTESQSQDYRELIKPMGNEKDVSQNFGRSTFSSPGNTSHWLGRRVQPAGTFNVQPSSSHGQAIFQSVPTDLRLRESIVLLTSQAQIKDKIGNFPIETATECLYQLIHFYAVVLWYSAYEAWESELALLIEGNVQRICEMIVQPEASKAVPPQESVRQTIRSPQLEPEVDIRSFIVGGAAFEDLLKGLHFIVSDRSLHFAIHVQDEDSILECMSEIAHNTNEAGSTGLSPMDLAITRVDFLRTTGFPESVISKSLRVVQGLKSAWPLDKLNMAPSLISDVVEAAAKRSLDSGTVSAYDPGSHDFWDLVTELSVFLPHSSPLDLKPTVQVYSCEVLELLSLIKSSKPHDDPQGGEISVPWTPLRIFSELAATVTITGSADSFELDTCGKLLHKFWGEAGLDALRLIAAGASINLLRSQDPLVHSTRSEAKQSAEEMVLHLLFGERGNSILSSSGEKSLFSLSKSSKSVLVVQDTSNNADLREALAWACAALRPNSFATLGLSKNKTCVSQGSFHELCHNNDVRLKLLVWNLGPLEEMSLKQLGEHHCWTALFAPGLVVPHRVERPWGKGLGMSFDMMVHLAASESCIWIDNGVSTPGQITFPDSQNETSDPDLTVQSGGYILGGYRTALVPTGRSNDGTRIQWHLETTDDCTTIVDLANLEILKRNWVRLQESDVSKFHDTTSYIGWYEKAEVLLGTDSVSQIPSWSGASPRHRSLHPASLNFTAVVGIGAAALGPLNAQIECGISCNFVNNVQAFERSNDYNAAIQHEWGKTALVVDNDKKRAYLVPKLSLVLHLCRVEALRVRPTSNTSAETSPAIPAAMPSVDGCEAALKFLQENEKTIFIGSEAPGGGTTLSQLFLRVHSDLLKAAGLRESPTRNALLESTIFATEIRGLLERPNTGSPLKVIKDTRITAWVRLAALADAVCICKDLGAAIRPVAVGNNQECECYELPHDRYLLAAHMTCLKIILERQSRAIEELSRCGELDFGEGYKMRLSGRRLWTKGHHEKHRRFWDKRAEIIQIIHKETGADGMLRRLLGTHGEADQRAEKPSLTGVVVFGIRD